MKSISHIKSSSVSSRWLSADTCNQGENCKEEGFFFNPIQAHLFGYSQFIIINKERFQTENTEDALISIINHMNTTVYKYSISLKTH